MWKRRRKIETKVSSSAGKKQWLRWKTMQTPAECIDGINNIHWWSQWMRPMDTPTECIGGINSIQWWSQWIPHCIAVFTAIRAIIILYCVILNRRFWYKFERWNVWFEIKVGVKFVDQCFPTPNGRIFVSLLNFAILIVFSMLCSVHSNIFNYCTLNKNGFLHIC